MLSRLFAAMLILGVSSGTCLAEALSAEKKAQLERDCRAEAEGSGLSGDDLDAHIRDCMAEFTDTSLGNNIRLDAR